MRYVASSCSAFGLAAAMLLGSCRTPELDPAPAPRPAAEGSALHATPAVVEPAPAALLDVAEAGAPLPPSAAERIVAEVLGSDGVLAEVMAAPERRLAGVVLTVDDNRVHRAAFGDVEGYAYPASAIKLPVAAALLVLLDGDASVDAGTTFELASMPAPPPAPCSGAPAPERTPRRDVVPRDAIAAALERSDNAAFNDMYDLAGRDAIQRVLHEAGYDGVRLAHRLARPPEARAANDRWPAVTVAHGAWRDEGASPPPPAVDVHGLEAGTAYVDACGARIDAPLSFVDHNAASLDDLARLLLNVLAPAADGARGDLALSASSRELLLAPMRRDPHAEEPASWHAPLWPGLLAAGAGDVEHGSRPGWAYGFFTDVGWVRSDDLLVVYAMHLFVDDDGVLNDNAYRYDDLARPVVAAFGEAVGKVVVTGVR